MVRKLSLSLFVLLLIYCNSDDNGVGPCVHSYKEPILNVTAIKDSLNKQVGFVKLYNLKINGSKVNGKSVISPSYSIVVDDTLYYCNVPFGFGTKEGTYTFTMEAEGYSPKKIIINNVKYATLKGGCPSYNDDGTDIALNIE